MTYIYTKTPNTMYRLFLFLILFSSLPQSSRATLKDLIGTIWNKFWSISCAFSTLVSRSKRSLDFPDVNNVDELYDYLYPSSDLKPEDFLPGGSARSSSSRFFASSWLDDIIQLWENGCQQLSSESGQKDEEELAVPTFGSYSGNSTTANSTASRLSFSSNSPVKKNIIGEPRLGLNKSKDLFFSVYGGDIEYFYPVWGWGIPFDNEITLLGFHGFKGIFPYR